MWNWRANKARNRNIQAAMHNCASEQLEDRSLLAGNVLASLNGPHLTVQGDTADNAIEIAVENNTVQVRGLNNTTINGGTAVFVVAANTDTATGNMLISLGSGNDTAVFARNVKLGGNVNVIGGAGNDSLSSTGAVFQRNVAFHGNNGNDTFSLQDSTIEGVAILHGHTGDDLISLTDMTLNGSLSIRTHEGEDGVSIRNLTGPGSIGINTGAADDDVAIRNSTIGGYVSIATKRNADFVVFDDNTFNGNVYVVTGRNNDAVDVRDSNTFNGFLHVHGGDSRGAGDAVSIAAANVFNEGNRIRSEESTTIPTGTPDRVDAANTGLFARATAADTAASSLVTSVSVTASSSKSDASLAGGNVIITRDASVTVKGTTLPGATVNLDSDNDGQFDDGTATADATGAYTFAAPITATRTDLYTSVTGDDGLNGRQTVRVESTVAGAGVNTAELVIEFVPTTNKIVQFKTTNEAGETQGFEIELWGAAGLAPGTVANFLQYSTDGRYTNSIIHRSVDTTNNSGTSVPFVIQGGGYKVSDGSISKVATFPVIASEFNSNRGNNRGTISMAHPGDTNQGSSQWFINLSDNATLNQDTADRRHTVFGRVLGEGMDVVDAIHALTEVSLSTATGDTALTDVPLRSAFAPFNRTLTGTVTTTANSTTIVGTGTKFLTELQGSSGVRSRIQINGQEFIVSAITDDTHLTVTVAPTAAATNVAAKSDFANDNQFVRFSTIAEILA